jgi:hypothetical protein
MIAKSLSLRQQLLGRDNLLQAGQTEVEKINEKRQLDSLSDMSWYPYYKTPSPTEGHSKLELPGAYP